MHLLSVDKVCIMLAASKVKVGVAKGHFACFASISSCLLALLHKADEWNDSSARADHHNGRIVALRHHEVGILDEAHDLGGHWLATIGQPLLLNVLEVARDKAVSHNFGAITKGHLIARQ